MFVNQDLASIAGQTPYPIGAFLFVQRGLEFTVSRAHGEEDPTLDLDDADTTVDRHVTGRMLCHGLRDLAIQEYGLLARTVLRKWNVRRCEDFGQIVFAMVDAGLMSKTPGDRIEDFEGVFDFADAFASELELTEKV